MQNNNIVNVVGDSILIKLIEPYKRVESIVTYEDITIGENTNNYFAKSFRWSYDNKQFSDFVPLNDINLQRLKIDPDKDFWIEYKYEAVELDTGHELEFSSIALEVITDNGRVLFENQTCANSCDSSDANCSANLIIEDCCGEDTFSPYDWANQANSLYDQLTEVTNSLFGHCIDYYRAEPDERSRDSFLKEDTIYTRDTVKEIKVLVPNNEFPSNEFQFDPFDGMGHEGFEVHITRKEFETAFGANERPRERDSIYIPLNQKMYSVSSVALSDEIFQMHAYWRVKLEKWEDRKNIYDSTEVEQKLDDLTSSMDEVFGEDIEDEFLKVTKPQQYRTIGTNKNDYVRSKLNVDISIADENINNNWTIVSKNYYELSKLDVGVLAAKYRQPVNVKSTEDRAFTFWFRSKFKKESPRINISNYSNNNGDLQITTAKEHNYDINNIIEITGANGLESNIYYVKQIIDNNNIVLDLEYSANITSGKIRKKQHAPVLYGYNINNPSSNGMSIELLQGYIKISINNTDYNFKSNHEYEEGKWYSAVINMSNKFKQLTVYLYKMDKPLTYSNPQSQDSSLELIYNETIPLNTDISINSGDTWNILGSLIDLTNIRIFKTPIEEESHDAVLNQYVVRDTQLALLVDNAIPQLKLMRLSNPR